MAGPTYTGVGAAPSRTVLDPVAARVAVDPLFHELVRRRDRTSFITVGLTMVMYFGYIFLLAFAPGIMSMHVTPVITMGFPLALAVIVLTILIVGFYVWQANGTFQRMQDRIVMEARR